MDHDGERLEEQDAEKMNTGRNGPAHAVSERNKHLLTLQSANKHDSFLPCPEN